MKALSEISVVLRNRIEQLDKGKMALCEEAGITARTLRHVLSGSEDFRLSTLLALTDRLGLELLIVPREAAEAVQIQPAAVAQVKTGVQAALDKLKGEPNAN